MGTFVYKAVNSQGRPTEGRLEAADSRAASFSLEKMGLIPVSIAEPVSRERLNLARFGLRWVSRRDILFFTEELSTLVRAGLPLDRSLSVAAELTSNPTLKNVIHDILKQIKGGQSLAEAMGGHPKYFSPLYINMIRAGEAGGILDAILARLTEFERSSDELRSYLTAALVYPILLTMVGLGSLGILFSLVIPRFATIFEDVGAEIPPLTLAMLTVSTSVRSYWWIMILAVAAIVLAARAWTRSRSGSREWDAMKLRIPLIGPTLLKIEVSRFSRTLGTLLASAVPLIMGVRIVQNIARNQIVSEAISKIADGARRGEGFSRPMQEAGVFPGLATHLVSVGEETGRLDTMLLQVADVYEKDVRTSVKALTSIFEPVIILVMGVLIGALVLSMLMAIFSINEIAL